MDYRTGLLPFYKEEKEEYTNIRTQCWEYRVMIFLGIAVSTTLYFILMIWLAA